MATATDRWDEQGIPLCKHCGGGTDFGKFHVDRGMPCIWYRCALPQTADCLKDQSINCKADFTRLLPLWETHEAYAILSESRSEYERVHDLNRYRIGPDCLALRPKRIGAAWQQLRVSAAIAIEWLRVCLRQGWLGNRGRHKNPASGHPNASTRRPSTSERNSNAGAAAFAGRRSRAGPAPPG